MNTKNTRKILLITFLFIGSNMATSQSASQESFQPLSYEQASHKADSVLALMTLEEKLSYIGGDRSFFIRSIPRLHLHEVYMTDATQGVHIRDQFQDADLSHYMLEKSTAFPCPIMLAATWNPALSYAYAQSIGEECRLGNIGILLGPGMNNYRVSQCGRNFEYFGEDPFLRSRMIEQYVHGVQHTGTVATLKHFVANNTDWFRRKSNSIVDERTLHEIYMPPFKAGIDAGARAVMTSYNQLNGEWCGQSKYVIDTLLHQEFGFQWLVMTDWWSVYDGEKVLTSGQDIEMPSAEAIKDVKKLLNEGKVKISDIDRMVKSILRTYFSMRFDEPQEKKSDPAMYKRHEEVALQTAREGIVLLKNESNILPITSGVKHILLTGEYADHNVTGGGSAEVKGYDQRLMIDELKKEFGEKISFVKDPSIEQIQSADMVLCNVGTFDNEGWDRPFELPADQEERLLNCVNHNPNTVVIVTSGSGIKMSDWNQKAKAILYAWYSGQNGNSALAEVLSGKTNPSGKLPMTIEKDFHDNPAHDYIPAGEQLYTGWNGEAEKVHPVFDIHYHEGIFTGYRWFEKNNVEPLYPFGYGLSYTHFDYSDMKVSKETIQERDSIQVAVTITNSGSRAGKEIVQLYVQDVECSVSRPIKELKGFKKVELEPGKSTTIEFVLTSRDLSFWNPNTKQWTAEKGSFNILIGASSRDIKLQKTIVLQ